MRSLTLPGASTTTEDEEDTYKLKRKLKRRYKQRAKRQRYEVGDSQDIWSNRKYKGPRKTLKKAFKNATQISTLGKGEWVQGPLSTIALD